MSKQIVWSDGMVLTQEHMTLQDSLQKAWLAFTQAQGLWKAQIDVASWDQGIIRWSNLVYIFAQGRVLHQGPGLGALIPGTLDVMQADTYDAPQELAVWIWPTGRYVEEETVWEGKNILLRSEEWSQGFTCPAGQMAVCVQRWQRRSRQWVLDDQFFPEVICIKASDHWLGVVEYLRVHCLRKAASTGADSGLRKELMTFVSFLGGCSTQSPWMLWLELTRLCNRIGDDIPEIPSYSAAHPEMWVNPLVAVLLRTIDSNRPEKGLELRIPRANQTLFSASFRGENWGFSKIILCWNRSTPFIGDEITLLRLAPVAQMPRLVRTGISGIAMVPKETPKREGAQYCWILSVDVASPLWTEALQSGNIAVHCMLAGDHDSFILREEIAP